MCVTGVEGVVVEEYSPVGELNRLWEFDREQREFYAGRFEMRPFGKDSGIASWSEDDEFLRRLPCFASGNSSGSLLAVWRHDDLDPAQWPVVAFGDEGGFGLVAADTVSFLRLLGADADLHVEPGRDDYPDSAWYDNDDHLRPTPGSERYVAWLATEFGLEPGDPDEIVDTAVEHWGDGLHDWLETYLPNFDRREPETD